MPSIEELALMSEDERSKRLKEINLLTHNK